MRGSLSAAYCDSGKSGEGVQSFLCVDYKYICEKLYLTKI